MHKVLLPVDGSRNSEDAASYIAGCVREVGQLEVHVLNVQALPEGWEVKRFLREDELAALAHEYGAAALAPALAILDAAGVDCTTHIEQGDVAKTIARMAEELGCDMVVMGSHGHGALQGLLLGSVVTKVLHLVKVPITLVK